MLDRASWPDAICLIAYIGDELQQEWIPFQSNTFFEAQMFETYKPSGRFGVMAIPLAIVAMVIAIAMAYVYHLALHWIPLIYISFLVTIGLGIGLGMVGSKIVLFGKVRNVALAMLIGLLLTLSALAGKFYFQHQQMITDTVAAIMEDPDAVGADPAEVRKFLQQEVTFVEHIKARVEQGWQIGRPGANGGAPISGIFVYIVWVLEFLIIAWSAIGVSSSAASQPFSEKLGEWASEEEIVMTLPITGDQMVSQINAATTVDELMDLPIPKTDESNQFAVYKVNSIQGQELEDAYLSVDLMSMYLDKDGSQKSDVSPLVKHAVFSSAQRKQLIENAELLNEALADYRDAVESGALEDSEDDDEAEPDQIESSDEPDSENGPET